MSRTDRPVAEIEQGMIPTPDGTSLCVYRLGKGDSTVIVPNAVYLLEHFAWLAREHTLITYDLRHRGRSAPVRDRTLLHRGVHHDVEDLETVRQFFKVEQPHLIGHSYLGVMVALYALSYPEHVDRIVQIGPAPPHWGTTYPAELTAPDLEEMATSEEARAVQRLREGGAREAAPKAFCEAWWRLMRRVLVVDPDRAHEVGDHFCEFENEWPASMEVHLSENIMPSLVRLHLGDDDLASVAAPVLVVHGRGDRNAPYGGGQEWARRLPDARLVSVPDAGHLPFLEQPELVYPAIARFLRGEWPEAAEIVEGA